MPESRPSASERGSPKDNDNQNYKKALRMGGQKKVEKKRAQHSGRRGRHQEKDEFNLSEKEKLLRGNRLPI